MVARGVRLPLGADRFPLLLRSLSRLAELSDEGLAPFLLPDTPYSFSHGSGKIAPMQAPSALAERRQVAALDGDADFLGLADPPCCATQAHLYYSGSTMTRFVNRRTASLSAVFYPDDGARAT